MNSFYKALSVYQDFTSLHKMANNLFKMLLKTTFDDWEVDKCYAARKYDKNCMCFAEN